MSNHEVIRSNAKLILRDVRGKNKAERKAVYDALCLGPPLLPIVAVLASCQSSQDKQWSDMQVIMERTQR